MDFRSRWVIQSDKQATAHLDISEELDIFSEDKSGHVCQVFWRNRNLFIGTFWNFNIFAGKSKAAARVAEHRVRKLDKQIRLIV